MYGAISHGSVFLWGRDLAPCCTHIHIYSVFDQLTSLLTATGLSGDVEVKKNTSGSNEIVLNCVSDKEKKNQTACSEKSNLRLKS